MLPLSWTQSLVWLGEMLLDNLIRPEDIDPCGRREPQPLGAAPGAPRASPARPDDPPPSPIPEARRAAAC